MFYGISLLAPSFGQSITFKDWENRPIQKEMIYIQEIKDPPNKIYQFLDSENNNYEYTLGKTQIIGGKIFIYKISNSDLIYGDYELRMVDSCEKKTFWINLKKNDDNDLSAIFKEIHRQMTDLSFLSSFDAYNYREKNKMYEAEIVKLKMQISNLENVIDKMKESLL